MPTEKLPLAAKGLQLNFCKTLACDNFGDSDEQHYLVQRTNPKRPALVCRKCGAFPPLINNQEVLNELARQQQVQSHSLPSCNNSKCEHFGFDVLTHRELYHAFGYSGDRQRYRCKSCASTFVDKWSGENQKSLIQQKLLGFLFTGYSVREICRRLHINPKTFYDHINQIASRCRRHMSLFDSRLQHDRTSIQLASNATPLQPLSNNGVFWYASAEVNSGYVIAQHINYSETDEPGALLDHDPFQENAQYLSNTFVNEANSQPPIGSKSIFKRVDHKYQEILARANVEDPLGNYVSLNYPSKGAIIRPPYTSHAHFLEIQKAFSHCDSIEIYMPQEPMLRSAAMSIFLKRIKQNSIDLLYVTQDAAFPTEESGEKIDIHLVGWWRDRWAFTEINGQHKGICHLNGAEHNEAYWLKRASATVANEYQTRFYNQFTNLVNEPRRKLRPASLLPLLDIFRAWHNLCHQDKLGITPAQKLGLISKPITLAELLS